LLGVPTGTGTAGCPRPPARHSIPPPAVPPQTPPQSRVAFGSPPAQPFSPAPSTPHDPHDRKGERPRHNPAGSSPPEPAPSPSPPPPSGWRSRAAARSGPPAGGRSPPPSPVFCPTFSKPASPGTSPPARGKSASSGEPQDAAGSANPLSATRPAAPDFYPRSSPTTPAPPRPPPPHGKRPECLSSLGPTAETGSGAARRSSPSPAPPPAAGDRPRRNLLPAI